MTTMPYPFPKGESFEESSESLIEHGPLKERTNRTCHWSPFRIALAVVAIIVAAIELVVLETIFVHLSYHDQAPELLSELNKLVPDCKLSRNMRVSGGEFELDQRLPIMVVPVRQVLFRKDSAATWDHRSEKSRNATRDNWLSYVPRMPHHPCMCGRY